VHGILGVTQVSGEEQNSALSAFFKVRSNFREFPSLFSIEKLIMK